MVAYYITHEYEEKKNNNQLEPHTLRDSLLPREDKDKRSREQENNLKFKVKSRRMEPPLSGALGKSPIVSILFFFTRHSRDSNVITETNL